jgi:hypothetical protein
MARAMNKTTMGKINRERRLHERRAEKQMRREQRHAAAADTLAANEALELNPVDAEAGADDAEADTAAS